MAFFFASAILVPGIAVVQAFPFVAPRQSITTLDATHIKTFSPYTHFASAAYCPPSETLSWSCGVNCANNTGFEPVAAGGDGTLVQFWYVGFDPSLRTVIVTHQGTNRSYLLPLLTDGDFFLNNLDSSLFPGLPSDIMVHNGFRDEQSRTAADILSAVQTTMSQYGTSSVSLVGHSLGAAISLIDSIYLPLHLPSETVFQTILYGLPRVGNKAFASYVDANLNVTHVNNMKDPVPIVPGRFLGFMHPAGEVHISENGQWLACPGHDNPSTECIVGNVPDIQDGDLSNHDGPYNGIEMQCST